MGKGKCGKDHVANSGVIGERVHHKGKEVDQGIIIRIYIGGKEESAGGMTLPPSSRLNILVRCKRR